MIARWLAVAALLVALAACSEEAPAPRADPSNRAQVARGEKIYVEQCAACHGAKLEGQPNWRRRLPNGRLPAPPHDDSGHTWHHPEEVLFGITKLGLVPPYAPKDYESDMPAYAGKLSDDDIYAVLAYIMSHWSKEVLAVRREMLGNRAQ